MDEPKQLSPPSSRQDEAIHPQAIPADPSVTGSSVVFCGDPAQVSAGFAMALRLMGVDVPVQDDSEANPLEKGEGE